MRAFVDSAFGTIGKRVYAAIVVTALVYVTVHLVIGTSIFLATISTAPFIAIALAITVICGIAGTLQISETLVFSALLLWRGPRRFVAPPARIADDRLPFVVVHIPGRNEALIEVQRSIDSVLGLDYPAERIAIVHIDNSDDDRWTKVRASYANEPRVSVMHRDGTIGFKAGNLNVGLRALGPERDDLVVALLDVGDTFAPATLRPMATEFVNDPKLGFVQAVTRVCNPGDTIITKVESYIMNGWYRYSLGMQGHYGMPTITGHHALVRHAALLRVGGWDETKVSEDWSTANHILQDGWHAKWVDYWTDPARVSGEMSPPTLEGQQKQKGRWATGGTELVKAHLVAWMKDASLPWNYRFDLLTRVTGYPTASLRFLGKIIAPIWLSLAAFDHEETPLIEFAMLSATMQSVWLIYRGMLALTYLREGQFKVSAGILFCTPIQMAYSMPIIPHILYGVYKGMRYTINTFIVSPKRFEAEGLRRIILTQRLALGMAACFGVPATIILINETSNYVHVLAISLLFSSGCVIFGVFLVPVTQRVRGMLNRST